MKRLIPILLTLCLVLALTACGSGGGSKPLIPANSESGQKPAETKAPETKAPATEAPATEAPATEAPATEAPATEAPETQAPATEAPSPVVELTKGVVENGVWTNESLNLRCVLPEGWSFYDEEQIAQINNMSQEMFEDTEVADAIAQAGQYMDLFAASASGTDNINLIIQASNVVLDTMTEQEIFEALEQTYRAQFASAGMETEGYEILNGTFCGEEKAILHLEMTMSGIHMTEYQIWIRSNPSYVGILTISTINLDDPQTVLDCFSALH